MAAVGWGSMPTQAETKLWLDKLVEVKRKRARYQEMAAEDLIGFDELRRRIAELEDTRTLAERELRSLQQRRHVYGMLSIEAAAGPKWLAGSLRRCYKC